MNKDRITIRPNWEINGHHKNLCFVDNNHTRGDDMNQLRVIIYICILGMLIYSQISFAETDEEVPFLINNGKCPNSEKYGACEFR